METVTLVYFNSEKRVATRVAAISDGQVTIEAVLKNCRKPWTTCLAYKADKIVAQFCATDTLKIGEDK